eukprot:COSAG06_NODE_1314_length_9887_cov_10.607070_9_plen_229_part_00
MFGRATSAHVGVCSPRRRSPRRARGACSRRTATDRRASATCTRAAFARLPFLSTRKSRRSEEGASCLLPCLANEDASIPSMEAEVCYAAARMLAAGAAASVRGTAGKQAAGRLQPLNQRWGGYGGPVRARRVVLSMVSFPTPWPPHNDARSLHYMYNVRRCTAHSCDSSNGTPSRRAPWRCASDIPVPATAARGLAEAGSVARLLSLALLAPGGFCMSSWCCYREDES